MEVNRSRPKTPKPSEVVYPLKKPLSRKPIKPPKNSLKPKSAAKALVCQRGGGFFKIFKKPNLHGNGFF